jgi:hypothetical protein
VSLQIRAISQYLEVDLRMLRKHSILACFRRNLKDNYQEVYHRPDLLQDYQRQEQLEDKDNQMDYEMIVQEEAMISQH